MDNNLIKWFKCLTSIEQVDLINTLSEECVKGDPKNWSILSKNIINMQAIILDQQRTRNAACEFALINALSFIDKKKMPSDIAKTTANFVIRYLKEYCGGEFNRHFNVKTFLDGIEEMTMSKEDIKEYYDKQEG